jgi:hypothetical protein
VTTTNSARASWLSLSTLFLIKLFLHARDFCSVPDGTGSGTRGSLFVYRKTNFWCRVLANALSSQKLECNGIPPAFLRSGATGLRVSLNHGYPGPCKSLCVAVLLLNPCQNLWQMPVHLLASGRESLLFLRREEHEMPIDQAQISSAED